MSDTKSVWKKYAAAALAVVSVVGFASCGSSNGAGSDDSATSELEQVKEETVRSCSARKGTYAPFSYHDTDDNLDRLRCGDRHRSRRGTWCQGKFVERIGIRCSRVWTRKKFDTVADQVTPNDERKQKYDFTDLYTYSQASR